MAKTPPKDPIDGGACVAPRPFMPARQEWLTSLRAGGKSAITVECYDHDLDCIAAAAGGDCSSHHRIAEFDQTTVDALVADWESAGASRSSVLRRLSALRAFAAFLCLQGANCGQVLAAKLPRPIRNPRLSLDQEELDALTGTVPAGPPSPIAIRTHSIVILKAETGLTTGEIADLDLIDFDLERQAIRVVRTHLEPRVLRVSAKASLALATYLEKVRGNAPGALFLSVRGTRLCERAIQLTFRQMRRQRGVREDVTPRSLRHSLGFAFADSGVAVAVVAEMMGLTVGSAARYFYSKERR